MATEIAMARTPHRVSLAGGGTDIPEFFKQHGYGATVGIAIKPLSMFTITLRNWDDNDVKFRYKGPTVEKRTADELTADVPQRIVRAAASRVGIERGFELTSQSGTSYSKGGSGLGSSSSFVASVLLAMHAFKGDKFVANRQLSPAERIELAEEAYYLEREGIGSHCGKQDQYTAVFGGMHYFRYNSNGNVDVTPISLSVENRLRLTGQLHLFYTGLHREAEGILKKQAENADAKAYAMLKMRDLADQARDRLLADDVDFVGEHLDRGWQLKKGLVDSITNTDIDRAYRGAQNAGATGGRLIGAGAGGYLLLAIPPRTADEVRKFMRQDKMEERPFIIDDLGSRLLRFDE